MIEKINIRDFKYKEYSGEPLDKPLVLLHPENYQGQREKVVIVDLDNVVFYTEPIFDYVKEKGWNSSVYFPYFHTQAGFCPVNRWCFDLIRLVSSSVNKVIFLTARSEEIFEITKDALDRCFSDLSYGLWMRDEDDFRPANEVKEDILKDCILSKYDVVFAMDDDIENCNMFAKYGIPVLHVINAEGRKLDEDVNSSKYFFKLN